MLNDQKGSVVAPEPEVEILAWQILVPPWLDVSNSLQLQVGQSLPSWAPLESIQSSRHLSFTSTSVTLSPSSFSYVFRVEKYLCLKPITKMENCNKDVSKCEDTSENMKKTLEKLVNLETS